VPKKKREEDEDEESPDKCETEDESSYFEDDNLFDELERNFERDFERMRRMIFDILNTYHTSNMKEVGDDWRLSKPIVYGFSLKIGPDGEPVFQKFGNLPEHIEKPGVGREFALPPPREPLTDVVDSRDSFSVTMEMPGVEKDEINLSVVDGVLKVNVNSRDRRYVKEIPLPRDVDENSAKASFRNGVLDITFQKNPEKKEKEHKIKIQ